jgi:hypothetical protein
MSTGFRGQCLVRIEGRVSPCKKCVDTWQGECRRTGEDGDRVDVKEPKKTIHTYRTLAVGAPAGVEAPAK